MTSFSYPRCNSFSLGRKRKPLAVHAFIEIAGGHLLEVSLGIAAGDDPIGGTVEDAVDLISHNLGGTFATTPESQASLDNLTLAAQVEAILISSFPDAKAVAKDGVVFVSVRAPLSQHESAAVKAEGIAKRVPGVKEVKAHVVPIMTPD